MSDRHLQLVREWIDAYYTYRDAELRALAHPEIEIRPRAGLGERLYTGADGVDRWLVDAGPERSPVTTCSTGVLADGRVLAESTVVDTSVVALFEVRDERIAKVTMYISDRDLLQHLGVIECPPTQVTTWRIGALQRVDRAMQKLGVSDRRDL